MALIVEIKTGIPIVDPPVHKIQLAVQMELLKENPDLKTPGLAKMVKADNMGIERHWYELDGKKITGITTYLSQLVTWKYEDDYYARRGKFVHQMLQFIDERPGFNWKPYLEVNMEGHPDQEFVGTCIENYLKFKDEYKLAGLQVLSEVPLASGKMEVAATLDKIFITPGIPRMILLYLGKKFEVVEVKSREVPFLINDFRVIRRMWQMTKGKFTPPDALDDLEKIYNGEKVRENLKKYIKERRKP